MQLPDPAAARDIHLVADWVELAAAADRNGLVIGDALINAREEATNRSGRPTTPAKTDKWNSEVEQVWALLRARADYYGDAYPFEPASDALDLRTLSIDDRRLAYAFLLASASLAAFPSTDRHRLTDAFERASRCVMAAMLPEGATVSIFGTASKPGERYDQHRLVDRLEKLAQDLASELTPEARGQAAGATPRVSGDGGLDLVGWLDLAGSRKRAPIYFGQCACGHDWRVKPYEVMADTWHQRIAPVSPIVPVTLIPHAYRDQDNEWLDLFPVTSTVLVDRPRWLRLLNSSARLQEALADLPRTWMLAQLPGFSAA